MNSLTSISSKPNVIINKGIPTIETLSELAVESAEGRDSQSKKKKKKKKKSAAAAEKKDNSDSKSESFSTATNEREQSLDNLKD